MKKLMIICIVIMLLVVCTLPMKGDPIRVTPVNEDLIDRIVLYDIKSRNGLFSIKEWYCNYVTIYTSANRHGYWIVSPLLHTFELQSDMNVLNMLPEELFKI